MEREHWTAGERSRFPNGRWEATLSRALRRTEGTRREFALRYAPSAPFPLPELFCFARCASIGGALYIIYAFDEKNTPIF